MTNNQDNKCETGARKYPAASGQTTDEISQDAVVSKRKKPYGLTSSVADTNAKTRHVDGQKPSRPTSSPDAAKSTGAGPALAEHSKDAQAPQGGRQSGPYIKK